MERYVIYGLFVALIILGFKYYYLCTENEDLRAKYDSLANLYAIEQTNTNMLRNSIESQNRLIEQYKETAKVYDTTIDRLNQKLSNMNQKEIGYDKVDKDITSEEAIRCLKEKAVSLSQ